MTDMGAAGAAGQLEEIYALGVEKVIVYGSCGALEKGIEDCAIIIPINLSTIGESAFYQCQNIKNVYIRF